MTELTLHGVPHPDLGGYVLGILPPDEAAAFERHLGSCSACRIEFQELAPLPPLLAHLADIDEPSAALYDRTVRAIGATRLRARRVRRGLVALSAAAAIALGGLGVQWATHGDDARAIALSATAAGSGSGRASVRSGGDGADVTLRVSGLGALPPGAAYECWWTKKDGTKVSAGSFFVDEHGDATVHLHVGANLANAGVLAVTLEPGDGNPASSGQAVLRADVGAA